MTVARRRSEESDVMTNRQLAEIQAWYERFDMHTVIGGSSLHLAIINVRELLQEVRRLGQENGKLELFFRNHTGGMP